MPGSLHHKATRLEFVAVAFVDGMMEDKAWQELKRDLDMIEIV